MVRSVILLSSLGLLGCRPTSAPPAAITDCAAEAKLVLEQMQQSRGCRVDSECTLLKVEGISPCGAPVNVTNEPALRERVVRWRASCRPPHADCIGGFVARCDAGLCTAVAGPAGY